eukprot:TRINITY_DN58010_c0_g1_i1.p1 TRINITY_DN58010_c0_g1~~TRINITY_DN58010_c0_g1_i1.p1  ORF type:complete len:143 (-),score=32.58 TRINITY_DN58010_c0_g1_i1:45-473(-)
MIEPFEVDCVLKSQTKENRVMYLVKWKGYSSKQATWEQEFSLQRCEDAIERFKAKTKQDNNNDHDDNNHDAEDEDVPAEQEAHDDNEDECVIERVLEHRGNGQSLELKVKWQGKPASSNSWIRPSDVRSTIVRQFMKRHHLR